MIERLTTEQEEHTMAPTLRRPLSNEEAQRRWLLLNPGDRQPPTPGKKTTR